MMMNGWHMYGWGGGFMILVWILLTGVAIYLAVTVADRRRGQGTTHESALDILKKRYASGEISGEEFEKIKHDIQ